MIGLDIGAEAFHEQVKKCSTVVQKKLEKSQNFLFPFLNLFGNHVR
jgi:hypothetical protein